MHTLRDTLHYVPSFQSNKEINIHISVYFMQQDLVNIQKVGREATNNSCHKSIGQRQFPKWESSLSDIWCTMASIACRGTTLTRNRNITSTRAGQNWLFGSGFILWVDTYYIFRANVFIITYNFTACSKHLIFKHPNFPRFKVTN